MMNGTDGPVELVLVSSDSSQFIKFTEDALIKDLRSRRTKAALNDGDDEEEDGGDDDETVNDDPPRIRALVRWRRDSLRVMCQDSKCAEWVK